MPKLLTNRELELLNVIANLAVKVDNWCPMNGKHENRYVLLKRAVKSLSFDIDEDDIAEICEEITGS